MITGAFTGGNVGQAGVTVEATQYVYVKQFKNGQPADLTESRPSSPAGHARPRLLVWRGRAAPPVSRP